MSRERYVIGVDFGTLSGRALVARVSDGAECGTATCEYPHGVIDRVFPATDADGASGAAGGGGGGGGEEPRKGK
jgi:ribulose kinase